MKKYVPISITIITPSGREYTRECKNYYEFITFDCQIWDLEQPFETNSFKYRLKCNGELVTFEWICEYFGGKILNL